MPVYHKNPQARKISRNGLAGQPILSILLDPGTPLHQHKPPMGCFLSLFFALGPAVCRQCPNLGKSFLDLIFLD